MTRDRGDGFLIAGFPYWPGPHPCAWAYLENMGSGNEDGIRDAMKWNVSKGLLRYALCAILT
jgi:hypothetical protein